MACHVHKDPLDYCMLVEYAKRFLFVELGGVRIGGVYSRLGAVVHEMMHWLERVQTVIYNGR